MGSLMLARDGVWRRCDVVGCLLAEASELVLVEAAVVLPTGFFGCCPGWLVAGMWLG
jgi:hypothetical protein